MLRFWEHRWWCDLANHQFLASDRLVNFNFNRHRQLVIQSNCRELSQQNFSECPPTNHLWQKNPLPTNSMSSSSDATIFHVHMFALRMSQVKLSRKFYAENKFSFHAKSDRFGKISLKSRKINWIEPDVVILIGLLMATFNWKILELMPLDATNSRRNLKYQCFIPAHNSAVTWPIFS